MRCRCCCVDISPAVGGTNPRPWIYPEPSSGKPPITYSISFECAACQGTHELVMWEGWDADDDVEAEEASPLVKEAA